MLGECMEKTNRETMSRNLNKRNGRGQGYDKGRSCETTILEDEGGG